MKYLFIFLSAAGLTQTFASPLSGRIYRGYEAFEGVLPFQVLLYIRGTQYIDTCSGVLIGKFWILTAAHCVEDFKSTSIYAYLGTVQFTEHKTARKVRPNSVYIHEGYNTLTLANDIALLKVDKVEYSKNIQRAQLPSIEKGKKKAFLNDIALASGWGANGDKTQISDVLRYTLVQVVSQKICERTYFGPEEFRKSEICVGTDMVGSPCLGDSGGPLLAVPSHVLIGILSSTYADDCESGKPVIYTSITEHRSWIKATTGI